LSDTQNGEITLEQIRFSLRIAIEYGDTKLLLNTLAGFHPNGHNPQIVLSTLRDLREESDYNLRGDAEVWEGALKGFNLATGEVQQIVEQKRGRNAPLFKHEPDDDDESDPTDESRLGLFLLKHYYLEARKTT